MKNNDRDRSTSEGLKKGKKNVYRRPKNADMTSRRSTSGYEDVYSSAGGKKKRNIKLILTNVVLSLCLILSSLGFTAGTLGNMQLIQDNDVNDVETNLDLEPVEISDHEDVSYFLVAGLDLSETLTDIIMVVCFDLANNQASILQIPRDTYVGTEANSYLRGGGTGKINSVYNRAVEGESKIKALMRCINDQLGLPIDHYVTITIPGFRDIIDAMGGVTMTLDRTYTVEDSRPTDHGGSAVKITIGPGTVKLKGYEAEGFVRHRNSYSKGDIGRVEAQRKFYKALMKKVTDLGKKDLLNVARTCYDDVSTDLTVAQMLGYVGKLSEMKASNITITGIPGQAGTRNGQSYYFPHKNELVDVLNEQMRPYEEEILTVNDISIQDCPNPYTWNWLEDTELLGEAEQPQSTTTSN